MFTLKRPYLSSNLKKSAKKRYHFEICQVGCICISAQKDGWRAVLALLLRWHCRAGCHCFYAPRRRLKDLHPRLETARDGHNLIAALHIVIPAEFHAYGHEPGEAGRPNYTVALSVGGGRPLPVLSQGAVQRDFDPTATVNVYGNPVFAFFASLPPMRRASPLADMSMLLCSNRKCMPVNEQFAGIVPRRSPVLDVMPWRAQWQEIRQRPPVAASVAQQDDQEEGGNDDVASELWANETAQANGGWGDEKVEKLPPPDGFDVRLTPRFLDDTLEISGLGKALLFGIIAGLCSMPCHACCRCLPSR